MSPRKRPTKGWRTMWVDVPRDRGSRVDSLTFLRAFLARWLVVMIVIAALLVATGHGWANVIAIVVVVTGALNLLSVHVKLHRERSA